MRLFSILIAIIVAASLYAWVFERSAVLEFAGAATTPVGAEGNDTPGDAANAVSVVTMQSRAADIDSSVRLTGQTEANRQVEMRAETSGRIVSDPLRKGMFVEAGQLLCHLDPGTRQINLAEAEARLAEARARDPESRSRVAEAEAMLNEAQIEQNAAVRLNQDGFASETRVASANATVESALAALEQAKSGIQAMSAGIQAAEAAVASAETELERLNILAPFVGVLESDTAELGALMQPGSLCATVIQLDPIKLVAYVPETEVDKINLGAEAQARLTSGREVTGTVTFLSRAADDQTRTFAVEVSLPNPELSIRDGQTAEIVIEADGRKAHLLPQSALTLNDDGALGVRVVNEDQAALFVPVQVLRDTVDGVWVSGLDETAEVIVVGQEFVTDGVPVRVAPAEATQ